MIFHRSYYSHSASDSTVTEIRIDRVGPFRYKGSKTVKRGHGRSDGQVVYGRSVKAVQRKLRVGSHR